MNNDESLGCEGAARMVRPEMQITRRLVVPGADDRGEREVFEAAIPTGWHIKRESDRAINVQGPIGGCIVTDIELLDRKIPSEILFALCRDLLSAAQPASAPEKPFPAPGTWFPTDVLGNPMRQTSPGKWEVAVWPASAPSVEQDEPIHHRQAWAALTDALQRVSREGGVADDLCQAIDKFSDVLMGPQPAREPIPEDCDARKIMLDIVPGDGSGLEVFAKNVDDVVRKLTELSERIDAAEQPAREPARNPGQGRGRVMGMNYIRRTYAVPAKRGARVEYTGEISPTIGTITGAEGARLRIRMDGETHSGIYHPTWKLRYLPTTQPKDAP